jgi:hypothetical protein
MKRLQHKVNLVPVIAKADTLTVAETKRLKFNVSFCCCLGVLNDRIHMDYLPGCLAITMIVS